MRIGLGVYVGRGKVMCSIQEKLKSMDSSHYCPSCGESKAIENDYCKDCENESDIVYLNVDYLGVAMYPYDSE